MSSALNPNRSVVLNELSITEADLHRLAEAVVEQAHCLDVDLPVQDAALCVQHLLYVQQVNEYINLTRITDLDEALTLHIVDSLALLRALPHEPKRFLDMGTGAGFPGIPCGCVLDSKGVLLDSVGKKVLAVQAFIDRLAVSNLEAVHDRLESYAVDHRESFDTVFARAVGQLPLLIEYAAPFLVEGGYIVLSKANPSNDEISAGDSCADICGFTRIGSDEFELPFDMGHRMTFIYEKTHDARVKLPRAVGLAKKSPLV